MLALAVVAAGASALATGGALARPPAARAVPVTRAHVTSARLWLGVHAPFRSVAAARRYFGMVSRQFGRPTPVRRLGSQAVFVPGQDEVTLQLVVRRDDDVLTLSLAWSRSLARQRAALTLLARDVTARPRRRERPQTEEFDGDELYLVLSGEARFELDGESVSAPAGTFVSVGTAVTRTAFAEQAGTTVLAIGAGRPDQVYRPLGWELWSQARALFDQGRHEEVVERLRPLVESAPRYPLVFYNLACSESMLGRVDDALADLRRAVELEPSFARYAREEEDLAAIRDAPQFAEITGG